jgi:hypothetical protein
MPFRPRRPLNRGVGAIAVAGVTAVTCVASLGGSAAARDSAPRTTWAASAASYARMQQSGVLAPTKVRLRLNRTTVRYRHAVVAGIRLDASATNRHVTVFVAPPSGWAHVVKRITVARHHTAHVRVRAAETSWISAVFYGDDRHAESSASRVVHVRAKLTGRLRGNYRQRGRYRLFHHRSRAVFATHVKPAKAGQQVCFPLQYRTHRGWVATKRQCTTLNSDSYGSVYVAGRPPVGTEVRIRARYAGDHANRTGHSRWFYFEYTR